MVEALTVFRGDGGYNTIDTRESVAGADELRGNGAEDEGSQ